MAYEIYTGVHAFPESRLLYALGVGGALSSSRFKEGTLELRNFRASSPIKIQNRPTASCNTVKSQQMLFIFVYGLFNDAVSSSERIVSND
jgi:hypothetical protein